MTKEQCQEKIDKLDIVIDFVDYHNGIDTNGNDCLIYLTEIKSYFEVTLKLYELR